VHKINNEQGAQAKFLKLSAPRSGHFSPVAAE